MPFAHTASAASLSRPFWQRIAPAVSLLFGFALLSGCASTSVSPTKISTVSPYRACLQRCASLDGESAFVRDGCRRGCELALEQFPLHGGRYASSANCLEAVREMDKTGALANLEKRCQDIWEGQDRRAGCREAGDAFYGAVTENLCISDMP